MPKKTANETEAIILLLADKLCQIDEANIITADTPTTNAMIDGRLIVLRMACNQFGLLPITHPLSMW
jgi:hypothetical protein